MTDTGLLTVFLLGIVIGMLVGLTGFVAMALYAIVRAVKR